MQGTIRRLARSPLVAKLVRYAAASAVGVVIGQGLLFLFDTGLGWDEVVANICAVVISAGPAYLMNRYWVWQVRDRNSLHREVAPFWAMAVLGLVLSTAFVAWIRSYTEAAWAISAASLSGFGVLWIAKFLILDRVLFARPDQPDGAAEDGGGGRPGAGPSGDGAVAEGVGETVPPR